MTNLKTFSKVEESIKQPGNIAEKQYDPARRNVSLTSKEGKSRNEIVEKKIEVLEKAEEPKVDQNTQPEKHFSF